MDGVAASATMVPRSTSTTTTGAAATKAKKKTTNIVVVVVRIYTTTPTTPTTPTAANSSQQQQQQQQQHNKNHLSRHQQQRPRTLWQILSFLIALYVASLYATTTLGRRLLRVQRSNYNHIPMMNDDDSAVTTPTTTNTSGGNFQSDANEPFNDYVTTKTASWHRGTCKATTSVVKRNKNDKNENCSNKNSNKNSNSNTKHNDRKKKRKISGVLPAEFNPYYYAYLSDYQNERLADTSNGRGSAIVDDQDQSKNSNSSSSSSSDFTTN
jgi:hypothetical protein